MPGMSSGWCTYREKGEEEEGVEDGPGAGAGGERVYLVDGEERAEATAHTEGLRHDGHGQVALRLIM